LNKLLADENIPSKTVKALKQRGIDIVSVADSSPGLSDRAVIEQANDENRVIVTFDKDFGELIFRQRIKVKGLILLRFTPRSPDQIAERIEELLTRKITIKNRVIVVRADRIRVTPLK
jgi:predicted nuclease of predicted toxin-antitoxin system